MGTAVRFGFRTFDKSRIHQWLNSAELGLSFFLSGYILLCLVLFVTCSDAFWRDEINSINLIGLPHLADIWNNLDAESFPLAWLLLLRTWVIAGPGDSFLSLRILGFLTAFSVLACIWIASRLCDLRSPFFALLLLALNPTFLRTLAANRAYGFGVLSLLLTLISVLKYMQAPDWKGLLRSFLLALIAIHTLYYNVIFVLAMFAPVAYLLWMRGYRKPAGEMIAVFIVACVSLLPYLRVIQKQQSWSRLFAVTPSLHRLGTAVANCYNLNVVDGLIGLALIALVIVMYRRVLLGRPVFSVGDYYASFFCLAFFLSVAGYFTFLIRLSYPLQVWYFLVVFAISGIYIDVIIDRIVIRTSSWRIWRVTLITALLSSQGAAGIWAMTVRQTNLDLLAKQLNRTVKAGDLIIVDPFWFGITFNYYYRGSASWTTVPPLAGHSFGGLNYLKQAMERKVPVDLVRNKVDTTLRSGNRVFIVGNDTLLKKPDERYYAVSPANSMQNATRIYLAVCENLIKERLYKSDVDRYRVSMPDSDHVNFLERGSIYIICNSRQPPPVFAGAPRIDRVLKMIDQGD